MANTNPQLNGIARRGDIMARGPSGWGPVALVDLLQEVSENVADDSFFIVGTTDATKRLRFEVESQTTGKTMTVDTGAQTLSRTLTVPVLAGAANVVVREAALVDNAVVRADSTLGKIQNSGVIIDDSNNVTGVVALTIAGALAGVTTIANSSTITSGDLVRATYNGAAASRNGFLAFNSAGSDGLLSAWASSTYTTGGGIGWVVNDRGFIYSPTAFRLGVGTGATNYIEIGATGVATMPNGIIFANETLSTYDEGTFTPTIYGSGTAGTPTYTAQSGTYTRIGRSVNCNITIQITAKTGIAGDVRIGGLPFTILAGTLPAFNAGVYLGFTMVTGTQLNGFGIGGATYIAVYSCGSAVNAAVITDAEIAATTSIYCSIQYEI